MDATSPTAPVFPLLLSVGRALTAGIMRSVFLSYFLKNKAKKKPLLKKKRKTVQRLETLEKPTAA